MCIPILQLRYSLISHPFSTIHTHRSFGGCMQLFFLTSVYAYVLFFAANLISDGSELLLLVRIVSHTLFPAGNGVPPRSPHFVLAFARSASASHGSAHSVGYAHPNCFAAPTLTRFAPPFPKQFPSIKGLVGSVVLPVLGAVPDGAIVLFSGLGQKSRRGAQTNIAVGVGGKVTATSRTPSLDLCFPISYTSQAHDALSHTCRKSLALCFP